MHLKERKKESESRGASHGAPHLEPIFTYAVQGAGEIEVFLFVSESVPFLVVSVRGEDMKHVYAARTLDELSKQKVEDLVEEAFYNYYEKHHDAVNPFDRLRFDEDAIHRLTGFLVYKVVLALEQEMISAAQSYEG